MDLEEFSKEANQHLIDYTRNILAGCDEEFIENVLYAIKIAAPLRERTYLMFLSTGIMNLEWLKIEPFSFAFEYLIVSQLSIDDIIDSAHFRSNKPTLIIKTNKAKTILVSEYLHSIGYLTILSQKLKWDIKILNEVLDEFNQTSNIFFQYQYMCSALEGKSKISLDTMDKLAYGRTGRLIEFSLTIPAIISEKYEIGNALRVCGKWLGIAMQHRDDILDFISDPDILGKPIFLDYLNEQPNLVTSFFELQNIAQDTKTKIEELYKDLKNSKIRNISFNTEKIEEFLEIFKNEKAFELARNRVREYCLLAKNSLLSLPSSPYKSKLVNLINIVASIDYPWEKNNV